MAKLCWLCLTFFLLTSCGDPDPSADASDAGSDASQDADADADGGALGDSDLVDGDRGDGDIGDGDVGDGAPDASSDADIDPCPPTPFSPSPTPLDVPTPGTEYFVATDGSDSEAGTMEDPFRTVQHGIEQLSAGDTLTLRGGVYYVSELELSLRGTDDAWIRVRSFPGEHAIIDGGLPDFREPTGTDWEVVDESIGLYRSRSSFPVGELAGAWVIDEGLQLIQYENDTSIESEYYGPLDGMMPYYNGPGIQQRSDGRFYIRLTENPNDLIGPDGEDLAPALLETDPNNIRLAVYTAHTLIDMEDTSFLELEDLEFSSAYYLFDVSGAIEHLVVESCVLRIGRYGFLVRDGLVDARIYGNRFNGGVMRNVYWTDVKNRETNPVEAYPEFQSNMLGGVLVGSLVERNEFVNGFDAITIEDGSSDTQVRANIFRNFRDDSINVDSGVREIEIAWNLVWRAATGFSPLASDGEMGHVYVHHNVIDNSYPHHIGRPGNSRGDHYPQWAPLNPFGSHSGRATAAWRVYNNTIVTRRSGSSYSPANPFNINSNPELFVFDNIFLALDDRPLYRYHLESDGAHYDGNVPWQTIRTDGFWMFIDFGDGGDYANLEAFRDSGTSWEAVGIEVHPGFDVEILSSEPFDPVEVWNRYRPTESSIFTAGATGDDRDWPESAGLTYRGALDRCVD